MKRITRIAVIAVTLALGVAACGGEAGDDGALGVGERGLDRCSLISPDEATTWLESQVTATHADGIYGEPDLVTCLYQADDSANSVLVQVYDGDVFYAEKGSPARTGEDLDGLGEDAWTKDGDVNFLQNKWTVSVSRVIGSVTDESLLEMAKLISSRLP